MVPINPPSPRAPLGRRRSRRIRRKARRGMAERGESDSIAAPYDGVAPAPLVSFDLDAVNQAAAPGVQRTQGGRAHSELWLEAAYPAGGRTAFTSADVVELNPAL